MSPVEISMPTIDEVLRTMDYGSAPERADTARAWIAARSPADASGGPTAEHDVAAAFAAASAATPAWAALAPVSRARHLQALAKGLRERGRLLAELQALDNGRPIRASRHDLEAALLTFAHQAGAARCVGETHSGHRPLGTCGLILPADAPPLPVLGRRLAPALAAGNTVIVAAAGDTPLVALAFVEICHAAGLPPGVVSLAHGGESGAALTHHPDVAFPLQQPAQNRGTLFIVLADADLDAAVEGVAEALAGDTAAGACLLVQEGVAGRFAQKLQRRLGTIRFGDPLDPNTDIGADAPAAGLSARLGRAEADGAVLLRAEDRSATNRAEEKAEALPVLITGIEPASPLFGAGLPGLVATLTTFRTAGEALALAANSRIEGAAAVWSGSIDAGLDVALGVRADTVWVNAVDLADPAAPPPGSRIDDWLQPAWRAATPEGAPSRSGSPMGVSAGALAAARDAVERGAAAAGKAIGWSTAAARDRAAALQGLVEALDARRDPATPEAGAAADRAAFYAARAESPRGRIPTGLPRHLTLVLDEPFGLMGVVCPADLPLLGFVSLVLPALAAGNRVLAVTAEDSADLVAILATLPAGVVTLLAGERAALGVALAEHPDVAALRHSGSAAEAALIGQAAAETAKPIIGDGGRRRDWFSDRESQGADEFRAATRTRTLWVPYGV